MSNETPFIEVEGLRFLNIPSAQAVIDEIFRDDCYRINEIPDGSTVFDIGAFYGEFGLYMAERKGCTVYAYEPSKENFDIAMRNYVYNYDRCIIKNYALLNQAVTGIGKRATILYRPEHPAGSYITEYFKQGDVEAVKLSDLVKDKPRPICVKMDCEGSEVGIFRDDPDWMDHVDIITMEWHNHDGHLYKNELEKRGFKVELSGSGPPPRQEWSFGITGGLLFAKHQ